MSEWTITQSGTSQSFSSLGLLNLRRQRQSLAPTVVTLLADGLSADAPPLWAYDETVQIHRDGELWFSGKCSSTPRSGTGSAESHSYEFRDAFWDLERLVFQQTWKILDTTVDPNVLVDRFKSRLILGMSLSGSALTSGQVIAEVIAYAAASCGVAISAGTISAGVSFPWSEVVDITCAEAIRRMARYTPDAVGYLSPSGEFSWHVPTEATAFPLTTLDALDIVARDDLHLPAVVIKYERSSTFSSTDADGDPTSLTYNTTELDAHPEGATGQIVGSLLATIELAGARSNTVRQTISVQALPADLNTAAFWGEFRPWVLDTATYEDLVISATARTAPAPDQPKLVNRLLEGTIQDWMLSTNIDESDLNKVYATEEVFTAMCRCKIKATGTIKEDPLDVTLTTLNSLGGTSEFPVTKRTFTQVRDSSAPESAPIGLAAAIYNSRNRDWHQGTFSHTAEEHLDLDLGRAVTITGGLASWAIMYAPIQGLAEDVDLGRLTVTFGPPEHLGIQDLVELLRNNRTRIPPADPAARTTAVANSAGTVILGSKHPRSESASNLIGFRKLVVKDDVGTFILDPAEIIGPAIKQVSLRQLQVCENGATKTILILASESF